MRPVLAVAALMLASGTAAASGPPASTAGGHGALALGVLVGINSPLLDNATKTDLLKLIDDKALPAGKTGKISVTAKAVVCRGGDVDLAAFGCTLTFGAKTVTFAGRRANELYATLIEAGVQSDGAAGTIYESVHGLTCSLDPVVLAEKNGGGAACAFSPGPS
jgi:hypothetical protein